MSNEIATFEVNMSNLTYEEREQFFELVEKANMPPQKKWWEGTKFDIHSNDRFYTVAHDGSVCTLTNRNWATDKEAISFGNACKNRNYMQQRAKDIKRANLTANFAHVVNGDWAADWDDSTQAKYFIVFGYNHKWKVEMGFENRIEGVAYFKSEELAWRCVHEVILPFERGEL